MQRTLVRSILLLLAIILVPVTALADSLRGRVVDPQQARVAHADVVIMQGTTVVTTVKTAADGTFGPIALAAGEYDVVVAAPGLRAKPTHVKVAAGTNTVDLDVA